MNTDYIDLLSALTTSRTLPSKRTSVELVFLDSTIIKGISYNIELHNIALNTTKTVTRYPISLIHCVRNITKTIYPKLPPGFIIPSKRASKQWVISNIRALAYEVNNLALTRYDNTLINSVRLDSINATALELTMSRFWDSIPHHIRHTFLSILWDKYLYMLDSYQATQCPKAIYLWGCNNTNTTMPIGFRTLHRMSVRDGVSVINHNYKELPDHD